MEDEYEEIHYEETAYTMESNWTSMKTYVRGFQCEIKCCKCKTSMVVLECCLLKDDDETRI